MGNQHEIVGGNHVAEGVPDATQKRENRDFKAKKPRPPHCYRCKCNRHLVEACKADLDCYVCNKKNIHIAAKCPLLKMEKPTAAMSGYAKNELCFFRISVFDYRLETPYAAPTGLIKMTGGKLDATSIQTELAKLSRVEWAREALQHGEDSFLVTFPSEEELARMSEMEYKMRSSGVTLTISKWKHGGDAAPTYFLDEVWVHATGVPHAWRHYLGFWALGSMIGTTIDVDMYTYRKKGVIRILVGTLDKELLLLTTDVVFYKVGYEITFSMEDQYFEPAIPPPNSLVPREKDDDSEGNEGVAKDKERVQTTKKAKNTEDASVSKSMQGDNESAPMQTDGENLNRSIGHIVVAPSDPKTIFSPGKPLNLEEGKLSEKKLWDQKV
jgi:hypothetical protein